MSAWRERGGFQQAFRSRRLRSRDAEKAGRSVRRSVRAIAGRLRRRRHEAERSTACSPDSPRVEPSTEQTKPLAFRFAAATHDGPQRQ
jgi:hypothetical protein